MDYKLQVNINKTSFSLLLVLVIELLFLCHVSLANNTSYITLSNQIARQRQLEVIANNVANTDTLGFEQDDLVLRKVDYKQNSRRSNSFVFAETTYKSGEQGAVRVTNRPTDITVAGRGFLKVITPRGPRYTLDGSMIINNQNILVNMSGFPYANIESAPIELPENFQYIQITEDGSIFVDDEQIDRIGVFDFVETDPFIKEGNNLYKAAGQEFIPENYAIVSGALRQSNVNSTHAMAKMVEMQRAVGSTNNLMSEVAELEKAVISKLPTK